MPYVPGELIVRLKEGHDMAELSEINREFGVGQPSELFAARPSPEERLATLKKELAGLEQPAHGRWYWWQDGDSQDSQDYQKRLEQEKAQRLQQMEALEELIAHVQARQKKAPVGAEPASLDKTYLLKRDPSASVGPVLSAYSTHPAVRYAEPNYRYRLSTFPQTAPDDTYADPDRNRSWASGAWGQAEEDLWGIRKIEADKAWPISQGETAVVAVIDSGVATNHPDLAANIWINRREISGNRRDDDANGYVDDVHGWDFVNKADGTTDPHGHGTHVAGTIAAAGNNRLGVIGVAPRAKIMVVRGLGADGSGKSSDLAQGVQYAVDNGADVLNNSWGGMGQSQLLRDVFQYAYSRGVLSVAAAGNSNADAAFSQPAGFATVVTVAASTPNDLKASFSNFGFGTDISAPGGEENNILSTVLEPCVISREVPKLRVAAGYYRLRGTSMAAPHVSGAAALLVARYPQAGVDEIHARLRLGCDPMLGLPQEHRGLLGAGRLNVRRSLAVAPQPALFLESRSFAGDVSASGQVELKVTVRNLFASAGKVRLRFEVDSAKAMILSGGTFEGNLPSGGSINNHSKPLVLRLASHLKLGEVVTVDLVGETHTARVLESRGALRCKVGLLKDVSGSRSFSHATDFLYRDRDASFGDLDMDGRIDLLIGPQAFLQQLDGSFRPAKAFLPEQWTHQLADVDRDWDHDLVVCKDRRTSVSDPGFHLFRNDSPKADPFLVDASAWAGLTQSGNGSFGTVFLDYDNDGDADLLLTGDVLRLYRNRGNGQFEEVTAAVGLAGISAPFWTEIKTADFDLDGFMDFMLTNPSLSGRFYVYRNLAGASFRRAQTGIPWEGERAMSAAAGDYDNDGDPDLYLELVPQQKGKPSRKFLYRNRGNGTFEEVRDALSGIPEGYIHYFSAEWMDIDNDGYLDLVVPSASSSEQESLHVLHNEAGSGFSDWSAVSGFVPEGAAHASYGDFDADGDIDMVGYLQMGTGRARLYENQLNREVNRHWLEIRLRGTRSHLFGLGARVRVHVGGQVKSRQVVASGEMLMDPVHFGIGPFTRVDRVEVIWPSGAVTAKQNVPVDQIIVMEEGPLWQNRANPLDVNGDRAVSPIDILVLRNGINSRLNGKLGTNGKLPLPSPALRPAPYYDVNGDGYFTSNDLLQLMNYMNRTNQPQHPWQNPVNACDVNGDRAVSPIDILVLANGMNSRLNGKLGANGKLPAPSPGLRAPPYYDVNGDGYLTPNDLLRVVNTMNRPPEIRQMAMQGVTRPEVAVSFLGRAVDPEGGALTYRWDFGDGSYATGVSVRHAYRRRGLHRVTLTVTDPQGREAIRYGSVSVR